MRDSVQQMDLFDIVAPTFNEPVWKIGDIVQIKTAEELDNPDAETIGYLVDYRYGGKTGEVIEIILGRSITYIVQTKVGKAYLNETEIREG